MKKNNGGAAFPRPIGYVPGGGGGFHNNSQGGMSLRDYFAGKALTALISLNNEDAKNTAIVAYLAYCYADEMLRIREETKEEK